MLDDGIAHERPEQGSAPGGHRAPEPQSGRRESKSVFFAPIRDLGSLYIQHSSRGAGV